jgi:proprotein convertase subtilisin/kexin type 5
MLLLLPNLINCWFIWSDCINLIQTVQDKMLNSLSLIRKVIFLLMMFIIVKNNCPGLSNCAACSGGTCTTCVSGFDIATSCADCLSGYYPSSTFCVSCTSIRPQCTVCSDSSTCSECIVGYSAISDCADCDIGFYPNGGTCSMCLNAITNCYDCSSDTVCTQCLDGYKSAPGTTGPCTLCDEFYYMSNTNVCTACFLDLTNCLTCSSSSVCTACMDGFSLSSNCLQCDTGYYMVN